jgi:hypothetical protein
VPTQQTPPSEKGAGISSSGTPFIIEASKATSERMRALAEANDLSPSGLIKLGMALVEVLTDAKEGHHLAVVDSDGNVIQDIAGRRGK